MNQLTRQFLAMGTLLLAGCTTTRITDTARTGVEQLLISNAIDQTLEKTPLPDVTGYGVFLDAQYLDCVDKGYLVASLRHRLLSSGALLVDKKEDSTITVEVRSGGMGTDNTKSFVGMPSMSVPGLLPIEIPEVRVWERNSHYGTAKIGLVAYDTATGGMLFDSGRQLARADDSGWSVLGVGPFQRGAIRDEVRTATRQTPIVTQTATSNPADRR